MSGFDDSAGNPAHYLGHRDRLRGRFRVKQVRAWLDDLTEVPPYEEKPEFFSDWGDPREFTMGDLGIGECAGEVITAIDFGLTFAEREAFEAQVALDEGRPKEAADKATGNRQEIPPKLRHEATAAEGA